MRFISFTTGIALLVVTVGCATSASKRHADNGQPSAEQIVTEEISTLVGAIYVLDQGDIDGARQVLLAIASAKTDEIDLNRAVQADSEFRKSQCQVLRRLKDLRGKHSFLGRPDDSRLASDPQIREAETRRKKLLDSIECK
jgi:hypothetical protein